MMSLGTDKETARAWLEFTRLQVERHTGELPLDIPFHEMAWDKFDPVAVAKVLLDERASYFAHKEVLFAAYTTWVRSPTDDALWRDAVALTALAKMAQAEKLAFEHRDNVGWMADFVVRFEHIGPIFFEHIYYPIGGITSFAAAPSEQHFRSSLSDNDLYVRSISELIRIYHYCIDELVQDRRGRPSQNIASKLVSELASLEKRDRLLKDRTIKEQWSLRQSKVALIYAASATMVGKSQSLLDLLISGGATYDECHHLFAEWLGKAKFAAIHVLSGIVEVDASFECLAVLPPVEPIEIDTPEYSPAAVTKLRRSFLPR